MGRRTEEVRADGVGNREQPVALGVQPIALGHERIDDDEIAGAVQAQPLEVFQDPAIEALTRPASEAEGHVSQPRDAVNGQYVWIPARDGSVAVLIFETLAVDEVRMDVV